MSQFKNVLMFCGIIFSLSKKLFAITVIQIVLTSAQPIIIVILSSRIVQQLIDNIEPRQILYTISTLVLTNLFLSLLGVYLKSQISIQNDTIKDDFCLRVGQKIMKLPYERLEDPVLLDMKQQALLPIIQWGAYEFVINEAIPKMFCSILTIVTTITIVAHNNLLLLIPISFVSILCMFISSKRSLIINKIMMGVGLIDRKMRYYGQLAVDFSAGKEIRLFGLDKIIMNKIRHHSDSELYEFTKLLNSTSRFSILETILVQLQVYVIYGIVALDVINKGLSIGKFLEVTGLFANVGLAVFTLLNTFALVYVRGRSLAKFFEFDDIPIESNFDENTKTIKVVQDITIRNVSFAYNQSKNQILKNITFTIPAGKKIAIVGENGSGKTTLVKLICGLLKPTEGEIQIGGHILSGCANESVSAVFQDYKLFAFSIRENVEMSTPGKASTRSILERVGLLDDIEKLEKGLETPLFKSFDNYGIELSGGQGQKLAIARAMYKDTGVIILDEPSASLDPQAEADIFNNFQSIIEGKLPY